MVDGKHKALIKDGKIEQMSFRDSIFLGPWDGENPQVKENDKQGDTTDEDCVSSKSEQEDRSRDYLKPDENEKNLNEL